jgi:hypothetical protein
MSHSEFRSDLAAQYKQQSGGKSFDEAFPGAQVNLDVVAELARLATKYNGSRNKTRLEEDRDLKRSQWGRKPYNFLPDRFPKRMPDDADELQKMSESNLGKDLINLAEFCEKRPDFSGKEVVIRTNLLRIKQALLETPPLLRHLANCADRINQIARQREFSTTTLSDEERCELALAEYVQRTTRRPHLKEVTDILCAACLIQTREEDSEPKTHRSNRNFSLEAVQRRIHRIKKRNPGLVREAEVFMKFLERHSFDPSSLIQLFRAGAFSLGQDFNLND